MVVYRICKTKYASTLMASGFQGRWNYFNEFVIYCAENRSLATLELLVSCAGLKPIDKYSILSIKIPEPSSILNINKDDLPTNWRNLEAYPFTQQVGSEWFKKNEFLILKVPSAVIPQEFNFILNTNHSLFKNTELVNVEPYFWDNRLLTN